MKKEQFVFKDKANADIYVYKYLPDNISKIKAVVQIAHGMAETAERYIGFAKELTGCGYVVYINDHRGHGKTAGNVKNVGYLGEDGFNNMLEDMKELNDIIVKENPNVPVFLFGHSMGSLLSQRYISIYGDSLKGVILSGTSGKPGPMLNIGIMIAKHEVKKLGPKTKSERLNNMTFGNYNKAFKPCKTEFDWLSRDYKEVSKYINDPYCGTVFTTSFFYDFFRGVKQIHKKENMEKIPKDLHVYLFSGEKDPVGQNCKTIKRLIDMYIKLGIKDVKYKFYKDGRHEMLNEINKKEVIKDTIEWLDSKL